MSSSLAWLASTLSSVEMALTASLAVDRDLGSVYCTLSWEIRSTANTFTIYYIMVALVTSH